MISKKELYEKIRNRILTIHDAEKEGSVTNVMVADLLGWITDLIEGNRETAENVDQGGELAPSSDAVKSYIASLKGRSEGLASLGKDGKLLLSQLESSIQYDKMISMSEQDAFNLAMGFANSLPLLTVMKGMAVVGLLACFSDESNHVLTQVYISNMLDNGTGVFNGHEDGMMAIYHRSFSFDSPYLEKGKWTEWKQYGDSGIPQLFIDMWERYCLYAGKKYGEFNREKKVFMLNGIEHTYKEAIYNYNRCSVLSAGGDMNGRFYSDQDLKTVIIPFWALVNASANWLFQFCRNMEVIVFDTNYSAPTSMVSTFADCDKLREIKGRIGTTYLTEAKLQHAFWKCPSLELVNIEFNLPISFADSPKLSIESLKNGIQNKSNDNYVTITVHQDVYEKLTGNDPEWQKVMQDAAEKKISFAM